MHFGKQLYPTPKAVIEMMVAPYNYQNSGKTRFSNSLMNCQCYGLVDKTVLDPQAGTGNILSFINEDLGEYRKPDLYAIEIDTDLQSILKDKEHISLIGSDFLEYQQDVFFDVILMNPPFKNGAAHLLKAIEIAHDTDIVCLLNAETILNPYTQIRKELVEKIEQYGSYELLGNVFDTAERQTNVNIALVRLKVKKVGESFDFDFTDKELNSITFDETFATNEIARADMVGNMMIHFEQAKNAYKEYIQAEQKWHYYSQGLLTKDANMDNYDKKDLQPMKRYNSFNNQMKGIMWNKVINELGLQRLMTSKIKLNFDIFVQQQSSMGFTKENVKQFFELVVGNSTAILEQSIIDVFEMLTANGYEENRLIIKGWRTNSKYKVNKRVIAPKYVEYGKYRDAHSLKERGDKFSISYSGGDSYEDIDKMLCYISGKKYEDITTIKTALENRFNELGTVYTGDKVDTSCSSTFFDIKFFRKGTVHLKFKDDFLWREFNMRACIGKQWLPDNERSAWEAKKKAKRDAKKAQDNSILRIGEESVREDKPKRKVQKRNPRPKGQVSQYSKQVLALFTT